MTAPVEVILVALPEHTVALLMERRRFPDERLAEIVERLALTHTPSTKVRKQADLRPRPGQDRYMLQVLGESKAVGSLADALACALNTLADLDGGILERLENTGGRTRRNVARRREAIHPGRPDLNQRYTLEFRPGWWISTNYSYRDIRRILRDVCRETGLSFGGDLDLKRHVLKPSTEG